MTRKEQKEILGILEQAGWVPKVCDTLVPCFDNEVQAGIPTMTGDIVHDDSIMMSGELSDLETVCYVRVRGESMKDAGILPGDRVQLCMDALYEDGDIVVASIDEELTLKTFYRDNNGQCWLVPFNEDFSPILLSEDMNARILGRVDAVIRRTPRRPHAEVERIMRRAQQDGIIPSAKDARAIIADVADMVRCRRQWYAVYRALADMNLVGCEMYSIFVDMVYESVPDHPHLPTTDALRRMAVLSFRKPVSMWNQEHAPVLGSRFEEYVRIANRTLEGRQGTAGGTARNRRW